VRLPASPDPLHRRQLGPVIPFRRPRAPLRRPCRPPFIRARLPPGRRPHARMTRARPAASKGSTRRGWTRALLRGGPRRPVETSVDLSAQW